MKNVPSDIQIMIQCKDSHGETGSFMFDRLTGNQFGATYKDLVSLFDSSDYKFAKEHSMIKEQKTNTTPTNHILRTY